MLLKKGSMGPKVRKLQEGLNLLGHTLSVDDDFGSGTKRVVEEFQHDHGLYDDGVVGYDTASMFDRELRKLDDEKALQYLLLETYVPVAEYLPVEPVMMKWAKCPADIFPGRDGYDHLQLREDVANAYMDLYNTVHELGGILTTAGGKRTLSTQTNASRSKTSFHYTGRAFDMAVPTGMQNVKTDPYVIVGSEESRYWNVWCCSNLPIEELHHLTKHMDVRVTDRLTGTQMSRGLVKEVETRGVFFCFTELADLFGFKRIKARRSFFVQKVYSSAEWWHFQYEAGLAKGISEFGRELLKIYTPEEAEKFIYWDTVKDLKYGKHWG